MAQKLDVPAIRFKGFTDAWEQRELSDLYASSCSGGTPSASVPEYYNGTIPFLSIADLVERNVTETTKHITELGLANSTACIIPEGSISLAMYASVGKVGIMRVKVATSQAFFNMVFSSKKSRDFLFSRLERAEAYSEWDSLISTGTQRNLNANKLKQWVISTPKIEEQALVGKLFCKLDRLITLHQRKHEKLLNIKKALLEKMFV